MAGLRIANRVRDKELLGGHGLPSPCSFLLFFGSSLLWMHLTLPAVTHLSMPSHTVYPPLHSGLTGTSRGHSPHTHATTSMHMACSQVPSRMLSHVDVRQSPHRRNTQGLGALPVSLSAVCSAPVNWRMWIQFLQSMAFCMSILSSSHGLQPCLLLCQLGSKSFLMLETGRQYPCGTLESSSLLRSSRHSWLRYWSDKLAVRSCSLVSCNSSWQMPDFLVNAKQRPCVR